MGAEEENIAAAASKTDGKRRRSSCWSLSCFRPPPPEANVSAFSSSSDVITPDKKVALQSRWWRKFGEKKKTVPVNVVVDATPTREEEKSKPVKKTSVFHKDKRYKGPISTNPNQCQPQPPPAGAHDSRVHHVTSKCETRAEPAALCRTYDRAQTGTRTSHPGSPEQSRRRAASTARASRASLNKKPSTEAAAPEGRGELGSAFGLSVVAVVLALLLLCGRACTIACVCAWYYFLPRIRAMSAANDAGVGGRGAGGGEVDVSSEEYKKMVVLRGLLERDGRRRPSLTKMAGVH